MTDPKPAVGALSGEIEVRVSPWLPYESHDKDGKPTGQWVHAVRGDNGSLIVSRQAFNALQGKDGGNGEG